MEHQSTKKQVIRMNAKDYHGLRDMPEYLQKILDKDNNGEIDAVEKMMEGKNPLSVVSFKDVVDVLRGGYSHSEEASRQPLNQPSSQPTNQPPNSATPSIDAGSAGTVFRVMLILFVLAIALVILF